MRCNGDRLDYFHAGWTVITDHGMTTFDDPLYAMEETEFLARLHRVRYAVVSLRTGFGVLPFALVNDDQTILEVISAPETVCTADHQVEE